MQPVFLSYAICYRYDRKSQPDINKRPSSFYLIKTAFRHGQLTGISAICSSVKGLTLTLG